MDYEDKDTAQSLLFVQYDVALAVKLSVCSSSYGVSSLKKSSVKPTMVINVFIIVDVDKLKLFMTSRQNIYITYTQKINMLRLSANQLTNQCDFSIITGLTYK